MATELRRERRQQLSLTRRKAGARLTQRNRLVHTATERGGPVARREPRGGAVRGVHLPIHPREQRLRHRPSRQATELPRRRIGAVLPRQHVEHPRERVARDPRRHLRLRRAHVPRDERLTRILTLVRDHVVRLVAHQRSAERQRTLQLLRRAGGARASLKIHRRRHPFVAERREEPRLGGVGAGAGDRRDLSPALTPLPHVEHRRVHLHLTHGVERNAGGAAIRLAGPQLVATLHAVEADVGTGPPLTAERELRSRQRTEGGEPRHVAIEIGERVDLRLRDPRAPADAGLASGLGAAAHRDGRQLLQRRPQYEVRRGTRTDGEHDPAALAGHVPHPARPERVRPSQREPQQDVPAGAVRSDARGIPRGGIARFHDHELQRCAQRIAHGAGDPAHRRLRTRAGRGDREEREETEGAAEAR